MRIITHKGDLLENVKSGIIVHGCNAQGKMNSGFAKQIRALYPKVYYDYVKAFENGQAKVGDTVFSSVPPLIIANAITQEFYGRDKDVVYVDYGALGKCFKKISDHVKFLGYKEIHFPKIGAGLANGDWDRICKIIEENVDPSIELHFWDFSKSPD